jgi:hypothetical protein
MTIQVVGSLVLVTFLPHIVLARPRRSPSGINCTCHDSTGADGAKSAVEMQRRLTNEYPFLTTSLVSVFGFKRCLTVCSQETLDVSALFVILFRPALSVSGWAGCGSAEVGGVPVSGGVRGAGRLADR